MLSALEAAAESVFMGGKMLFAKVRVTDRLSSTWEESKAALEALVSDNFSPVLSDLKEAFADDVKPRIADFKDRFDDKVETLVDDVRHLGEEEVRPLFEDFAESFSERTQSLSVSLATWEDSYNYFVKARIDPLFGGEGRAWLKELQIEDEGTSVISFREREINRVIALGGVITVAGVVTMPVGGVIAFVACVPLAVYLIRWVLQQAYNSVVEERRLTMWVLIAANHALLWLGGHYVLGGLIFIMSAAGQKLSYNTQLRSHKQLTNIFGKLPRQVTIVTEGEEHEIPFESLKAGDVIVIHAGQMIPVDGVIVDGYASIDQHRLTGEAMPMEKECGDTVLASTVVLAGRLLVQVEKAGSDTVAAQIGEILNKTASHEMTISSAARRMADQSVAPTLVAAGAAWVAVGSAGAVAITNSVFGLNLMISGPLALRNYLLIATRRNILIKDGRSLELLTEIDTVIFDKTGTLTLDQMHIARIFTFSDLSILEVLRYAAAVEQRQTHPLALAILAAAQERRIKLPEIDETRYQVGHGLVARVEGHTVRAGSARFMKLDGIPVPAQVEDLQEASGELGHSLVMVAVDDYLAGVIELQPTVRPEAKRVIDELRRRRLDIHIISGDQEGPTRMLAETLGITHYTANTLPANKAKLVEELQAAGRKVCFVGDGINDSVALKKANVSVSLRGATTVAMDTAQIVLMDATLEHLPLIFDLAEDLKLNLRDTRMLAIVPTLGIWAGVFFLHLGILGAATIFEASLWAGIANAVRPLWKYKEKEELQAPEPQAPAASAL